MQCPRGPPPPWTKLNVDLIERLATTHKHVFICGQARSHCVNFSPPSCGLLVKSTSPTTRDIVDVITTNADQWQRSGKQIAKFHVIEDCMSDVARRWRWSNTTWWRRRRGSRPV